MNVFATTRLPYVSAALLFVSMAADVTAHFSGNMMLQVAGMGAMFGCVLSCGWCALRGVHARQRSTVTTRVALVSLALPGSVVVLTIWRWVTGVAGVSSFDGGYPVLVAFAFLLAVYQGWSGEAARRSDS